MNAQTQRPDLEAIEQRAMAARGPVTYHAVVVEDLPRLISYIRILEGVISATQAERARGVAR